MPTYPCFPYQEHKLSLGLFRKWVGEVNCVDNQEGFQTFSSNFLRFAQVKVVVIVSSKTNTLEYCQILTLLPRTHIAFTLAQKFLYVMTACFPSDVNILTIYSFSYSLRRSLQITGSSQYHLEILISFSLR